MSVNDPADDLRLTSTRPYGISKSAQTDVSQTGEILALLRCQYARCDIYGYEVSDKWLKEYAIKSGICTAQNYLNRAPTAMRLLSRTYDLKPICIVISRVNYDTKTGEAFAYPLAYSREEAKKLTKVEVERVRKGLGKAEGEKPRWLRLN